jgi:hypothetical protein
MAAQLKYVDPNRPRGWFTRLYAAFSNTRLGRFLSVHLVWKVDPPLMRLTRGHLGLDLTIPTALLETRGARSGKLRRNVVTSTTGTWSRSSPPNSASRSTRPGFTTSGPTQT